MPAALVTLAILFVPPLRSQDQSRHANDTTQAAANQAPLRGPSFIPDGKFQGSTLAGWHVLGQAVWGADDGDLIGKGNDSGGWLVLDRSYQDTGLYTSFRCIGSCDTGVLLRLHKTADGMQGTYLSI